MVAQYTTNFCEIHCTAVKRILKYLHGTTNYALCYSSASTGYQVPLAYTNVDYAGDLNDRKSRSDSIFFLNNGPVYALVASNHTPLLPRRSPNMLLLP